MNAFQFKNLRIGQAERVLAVIWICLEEYSIPSPKVHFKFCGRDRVEMTVYFSAVISAKMVAARLTDRLQATHGPASARMLPAIASGRGVCAAWPSEHDVLLGGGGEVWRSIS